MKKQIAVALTAVLVLTNTTACSESVPQTQPENQLSVSGSSNPTVEASTTDVDSTPGTDTNITAEKVRGIYGETEVPDIPYSKGNSEGAVSEIYEKEYMNQCLDSMVFETHTCGEYKISLVGDSVRTDKANFPGSIYTRHLRVEVEKNGTIIKREKVEDPAACYCDMFLYVPQYLTEFRLFEDKIGSYIDMYELDDPVIAMRYFYDDNPERTVKNAMEFAVIHDNNIEIGFFGISDIGTGIILDGNALGLNSENGEVCRMSTFAADEFEVLDSKTLLDNVAGIKYTFNFIDPQRGELYTAKKVAIDS